ncbi:hypothetical protein QUF84_14775 [Fictibacillus enclensis]|uniref:hypothetical protein n=1 Tax=Fictibacillus enclensis TaxID=1017270 RepID=UPI0025A25987|nr:hypothetical protein [Fictibacillus enclensis]MDM5338478.1 hypothetical protein [Fictibacillus enclensis]
MDLPFACNCGHSYLPTSNFVQLNDLFSKPIDQSNFLTNFIQQHMTNDEIHYFPKNLRLQGYTNPIEKFLIMRNKKGVEKRAVYFNRVNTKDASYSRLSTLVSHQRSVFKSIARHIRKRFLSRHKKCLHQSKHGLLRKGTCCYALAYLNWRKDIEGDLSYFDVDRGRRKNVRGNHTSSYYTHIHEQILSNLLDWVHQNTFNFLSEVSNEEVRRCINQWVLNRVYPLLIWHHFSKWEMSESFIRDEDEILIVNSLPFDEVNNLPFFLFSFDKETAQLTYQQDDSPVKYNKDLYCYMGSAKPIAEWM